MKPELKAAVLCSQGQLTVGDVKKAAVELCPHVPGSNRCCNDCYDTAGRILEQVIPEYTSRLFLWMADQYEAMPHSTKIVQDLYQRAGVDITQE